MTRGRSLIPIGFAAAAIAALVVSGCGGGSSASASSAQPKTASGNAATVGVAGTGPGKVLVDSQTKACGSS